MNPKEATMSRWKLHEEVKATIKFAVSLLATYSLGVSLAGFGLLALVAWAR
ncbi:MAG TPA: hypothetical protein VF775_06255 [Geobacteraceae bacterium]